MKIETTASGKAFLSGEYMALEGGRAIILSTPQSAKVSIFENNEANNTLFSSMSDHGYPFLIDEKLKIIWLEEDPKLLGSILSEGISQFNKGFSDVLKSPNNEAANNCAAFKGCNRSWETAARNLDFDSVASFADMIASDKRS